MAITYRGAGAVVYSATSPAPLSVTHNVTDLLVLLVGTKPDTATVTTPSGWTLLGSVAGGTGTTGVDAGPMRVSVFYKIATGTATSENAGSIAITGNNISAAQIFTYGLGAGMAWGVAGAGAADTDSTTTAFTATLPTDPGLTVNDELLVVGVTPTDTGDFSAQTVAASGMTTVTLTEVLEWVTATGNDMGGWVARGPVVTGTSTGAPTISSTSTVTGVNSTGPLYLVRIREIPAQATPSASDSGTLSVTESSSVVEIVSKSASDSGTHSVTGSASVSLGASPVAISLVDKTTGVLNNVATSWTSISFTPDANGLVVVDLSTTGGITDTATRAASVMSSTISGLSSWTVVQGSNPGVTAKTATYTFYATTGASPSSGTVTVNLGNATPDFEVSVWSASNVDQSNPVSDTASGLADANSALSMVFFNTVAETGDNVHVAVTSRNSSTTPSPTGSGLSLVNSITGVNPNATQYAFDGFTTADTVGATGLNNVHNSGTALIINNGVSSSATPISASDSGTHSTTDSVSIVASTIAVSDVGTHSAAEASSNSLSSALIDTGTHSVADISTLSVIVSGSDTGTHSTADSSAPSVIVTTSEGGTHSATETSAMFVTRSINDTGTHSAGDASTSFIVSSLSDSGTNSVSEAVSISVVLTGNDSGTISSSDASSIDVPYQELSRTDSGTHSASELSTPLVLASTTDSGTWSATDSSTAFKAIDITDSGTYSTSETSGMVRFYSLSDTGAHTVTDASSVFINDAKDIADTGTHSAVEGRSVSGTATAADTGTVSATDTATLFKTIAVNDSGTSSVSETTVVFNDRPAADAGIHSTSETASITISGLVAKSGSDSGTLTVTDSASATEVTLMVADAGSHNATETFSISSNLERTDAGTESVIEQTALDSYIATPDSGTHSVTDGALVVPRDTSGIPIDVWNGTQMVTGDLTVWDGTDFTTPTIFIWNGTDWS